MDLTRGSRPEAAALLIEEMATFTPRPRISAGSFETGATVTISEGGTEGSMERPPR
jgi:hypothetical protein